MKKVAGLLLALLFSLFAVAQSSLDTSSPDSSTPNSIEQARPSTDSTLQSATNNQADTISEATTTTDESNILLNNEQAMGFSLNSLLRGLLGMLTVILIAFVFSSNRKAINWKVVFIGLAIQVLLAFGVLTVPFVQAFFEFFSRVFVKILNFTNAGSEFLLGDLMNTESFGYIFAFQVLPTIVFFSALTSVLFYLGIIQKIVYALAWLMTKALQLSGAESLSVAGNIFLGQTESPLMIKAYLEKMTRSEILLVMLGGMATLAGGVLAAYISFLGNGDRLQELLFAKHLLAASIMAAPGAVVISKILVPQTESINKEVSVRQEKLGSNFLEAMSNGATEGFKLAANVAAMLLVFVSFIAMFNYIVGQMGEWSVWIFILFAFLSAFLFYFIKRKAPKATAFLGLLFLFVILFNYIGKDYFDFHAINSYIASKTNGDYTQITLEFLLGYTFAPLMWLLGVAVEDITLVGRLLGEKIIMSEFIGYVSLSELKNAGEFTHYKSIIMSTYMLAGFANFASIGIQIGGIGSLAPGKKTLLSQYGMKALLGGTLASLMSATIVGMIMG
ncbi:MAG: nucleoside transporter C-terminal domain-containing protein [Bacteroidales bacterium]